MPKLLLFTPCEKIIVDENRAASLIAILQGVTASSKEEIPKNAVTPKEWAVYTSWMQEKGDENKNFSQQLQILWPDGSEFHKHTTPFTIPKRIHQNRVGMVGFPIGQKGFLKINMWLEREGAQIGEVYSYTVEIKHGEQDDK